MRRSREQLEMEIDKFTIIERDGLIIGCAALYCFMEEAMAEMACVAIHPEYRNSNRGDTLIAKVAERGQAARHPPPVRAHYPLHPLVPGAGLRSLEVEDLPVAPTPLQLAAPLPRFCPRPFRNLLILCLVAVNCVLLQTRLTVQSQCRGICTCTPPQGGTRRGALPRQPKEDTSVLRTWVRGSAETRQ